MNLIKSRTVGFIGCGNMAQSIISGLINSNTVSKDRIFISNRSEKKLKKVADKYEVTPFLTNEELIDHCDIIFLSMKPQDLQEAIESIAMSFDQDKLVISLAAGYNLESLHKMLPNAQNIVRVMPNVGIRFQKSVTGYCMRGDSDMTEDTIKSLMKPLGYLVKAEDEQKLTAIMVASASGIGFVFELMQYFKDWVEGYGFEPEVAHKIIEETFAAANLLVAENKDADLYDLLGQVTSKKGVTQAGLESMRELDVERTLRISFEKAMLRDRELGRQ